MGLGLAGVNHCSRLQREGAAVSCLWHWVIGAEHDGLTEEVVGGVDSGLAPFSYERHACRGVICHHQELESSEKGDFSQVNKTSKLQKIKK